MLRCIRCSRKFLVYFFIR